MAKKFDNHINWRVTKVNEIAKGAIGQGQVMITLDSGRTNVKRNSFADIEIRQDIRDIKRAFEKSGRRVTSIMQSPFGTATKEFFMVVDREPAI